MHQKQPRFPLHYQILVAMIAATMVGVAINPGEVRLDDEVRLDVAILDDGSVTLEEKTAAGVTVFSDQFPSEESFERSYPRLAETLATQQTLPAVREPRVRVIEQPAGFLLIYQRFHGEVPATSQITGRTAAGFGGFWQPIVESNSGGMGGVLTKMARFVGDFFLRLLKMVTVPLILTSLVTGVTGLGSQGRFGRMFAGTLAYYVVTSVLAISIGLCVVNIIRPGDGAILPGGGRVIEEPPGQLTDILLDLLNRMVPTNPFESIAAGEFLSVITFAILVGMFINLVGGEHGRRLSGLAQSSFEVMMRMTSFVIMLAPIGVAGFMLYATATQGLDVFRTLAWYMMTVAIALVVHAAIILPAIVALAARRNPLQFSKDMSPALLTAFSTASSNATLPLTISCVEERAGVSNRTSSFVLPLGATINMDGTALYEVVAVMFIAQATPGVDLSISQQILVAFTALLASVGAAGIPHAGLVMMAIVLQAVGLPTESQGLIIAVDRVLDMCRTSVNVWSDSCGCAVMDRLAQSDQPEPDTQI